MSTRTGTRTAWPRPLAAAVAALALAGCVAAQPGVIKRPPAPPAKRAEIAPMPPSRAHVWVPGQWAWHGGRYVWVPGHWEVPPVPGHVWVPGGWAPRDSAYVWVDGHWRAR